jgi:hypothetical protein
VGDSGWDVLCVEQEARICQGACQTSPFDCLTEHESPGCNDPACCSEVCPRRLDCCNIAWNSDCVALANEHCK